MRKESLMFAGSVIFALTMVGIQGTIGLFVFGAAWLIFGRD